MKSSKQISVFHSISVLRMTKGHLMIFHLIDYNQIYVLLRDAAHTQAVAHKDLQFSREGKSEFILVAVEYEAFCLCKATTQLTNTSGKIKHHSFVSDNCGCKTLDCWFDCTDFQVMDERNLNIKRNQKHIS